MLITLSSSTMQFYRHFLGRGVDLLETGSHCEVQADPESLCSVGWPQTCNHTVSSAGINYRHAITPGSFSVIDTNVLYLLYQQSSISKMYILNTGNVISKIMEKSHF